VLPDGRLRAANGVNNIAYIDASHLEAYDGRPGARLGIDGLLRTLMRQGYLPLFAPDLATDRLERAGLLMLIAPAREFSGAERSAIRGFVSGGGALVCMVGAEQARPIAPLLADYQFRVPPSPVPPDEDSIEPEPLSAKQGRIDQSDARYMFYAAWPIECKAAGAKWWSVWTEGKSTQPIIISHSEQGGTVVVIGDTHFAANENQETADRASADNVLFWRWLLTRVVPGQKTWNPPPDAASPAGVPNKEGVHEGCVAQEGGEVSEK